jgi:hypothetical protein
MATITAASASAGDVQAAVDSATHGDTVLIPNGTVTWTSGVDATAKRVHIRAQNYTATPAGTAGAGATTRNVTITNNSSASLFSFTTGDDYHCGLAGVALLDGTGDGSHLYVRGSGTKPCLVNDLYLTLRERAWPAGRHIDWQSLGGVMWNLYVTHPAGKNLGTPTGESILLKSPRSWDTASTMGSLDTGGLVNWYCEDSTFLNVSWLDCDELGRAVVRRCTFDGSWSTTHGLSGAAGRHVEVYDNTFSVSYADRAIAGRYYWLRAGTGVFTDNVVNNAANPGAYGNITFLAIAEDFITPSSNPQNRQPGWGHNGTANVIDPIYAWNNAGARGSTWYIYTEWADNVQSGRELYVDGGAKPGYSKYTYPHPLRSGESPPPASSTPSPLGNRGSIAFML